MHGAGGADLHRVVSAAARLDIAPELGNHNEAALAELGYSPAEVADLRARKVI